MAGAQRALLPPSNSPHPPPNALYSGGCTARQRRRFPVITVPRNCKEEQFRGIVVSGLEHFQFEMLCISTIRPVVSRKKRSFSAHFGPGGAVPPPCALHKVSILPVRHSARVLGRMGEFEGEGPPFCRKQRPNGRPQAVSVRRRRSLTDIDSRAKGFLPPQGPLGDAGALRTSTAEQRGSFPLKTNKAAFRNAESGLCYCTWSGDAASVTWRLSCPDRPRPDRPWEERAAASATDCFPERRGPAASCG